MERIAVTGADSLPHPSGNPSHGSPNLPGGELGDAEIGLLALGPLATRDAQDHLENPLTSLFDRLLAIEDGATVDIHVVLQPTVHRRVGRDLNRWRRLATEHAAPARCKADHIGATSDLPRR